MARPLLIAGAGIAVSMVASCGGSDQPVVVGNLVAPQCDAGAICLPDGGPPDGAVCCIPGKADGGG